jgi:transporter family-2 protein
MHTIIFVFLAMGAGACIAIQASANGNFRRSLGDNPLFAAFFSICGTMLTASTVMFLLRPQVPSMSVLRETPWWNWIGGPLGGLIVLAGAVLAQERGAAFFIALVVGGQLLCSLLLDHFALMGLEQRLITPGRVLGVLLVVAGVLCIKYL